MNLSFIIPSLVSGGAERVVSLLAHNWSASGNTVEIISYQKHKDFYTINAPIIRTRIPFKKNNTIFQYFFIITFLRKTIKKNKDTYFISFLPKANILCLIASLGLKPKLIIAERNIINDPDIDYRQHVLRKLLYPRAWKISVQHQEIKDELLQSYSKIKREKIFITPNPIRKINIETKKNINSYFPNIKNDTPIYILAIGRFTKVKAYIDLLEIFNVALQTNKSIRLIILGDGQEHSTCKDYIQKENIANYVYLPGEIHSVDPWLLSATVFAHVAHYEGFPNVIAEAMAAGLPIIAFDAPSIKVLVKNNVNGIVVQNRNKEEFVEQLLALVEDPDKMQKYGKEGKKITSFYSIEHINTIWAKEVLT